MVRSVAIVLALSPIAAAAAPATPTAVARAYREAQRDFDQASLAALTAPEFVEISPLGEVDRRDAVLSFYAADKRQPAPPTSVSEENERTFGDTSIVTARVAFGSAALRAVYVARRYRGGWKLVSAQYTPLRTSPPTPR